MKKINTEINGSEYYRVTVTIGRDSNGNLIRKQFYGTGKKDAETKRDVPLNTVSKLLGHADISITAYIYPCYA